MLWRVPSKKFWRRTVTSVLDQTEANWRWYLLIRFPINHQIAKRLDHLVSKDPRVSIVQYEKAETNTQAINNVLPRLSSAFVFFLDQSAELHRSAISRVVSTAEKYPKSDIIYADESHVSRFGIHSCKTRKPNWSPERLNGQMYLGKFVVYRSKVIRQIGGLRSGFEGAHDYDLALRATESSETIRRTSQVLLYRRTAEPYAPFMEDERDIGWSVGLAALREHLGRTGLSINAERGDYHHSFRLTRDINEIENVSVIIPTRGSSGLVFGEQRVFIESFLKDLVENSRRINVDFVIVYDEDTPAPIIKRLRELAPDNIQLIRFEEAFNFSRKCNLGAVYAKYENLVFLNDDMQCLSTDVLAQLTAPLREEGVGMTGAKLYFEDGTIQHGGHLHDRGDNRINYYGASKNSPGKFGALLVNREVSGVTGACMAIKRSVFDQVGGFSELFPNSYNDVDLSNKVRADGHRILWLAEVKLTHFESKSRLPVVSPDDYSNILARWGKTSENLFA